MNVNPLPPQAYTRETLQKAYTWLLSQSASVKDLATSQDMLVSMYLKAQRNGDAALETPSIQNFKQELKNLANLMGDLQTPPNAASHVNPATVKSAPVAGLTQQFSESVTSPVATLASNGHSGSSTITVQLDAQSMKALNELKASLNLSSESEALRALIALGAKQFKKLS